MPSHNSLQVGILLTSSNSPEVSVPILLDNAELIQEGIVVDHLLHLLEGLIPRPKIVEVFLPHLLLPVVAKLLPQNRVYSQFAPLDNQLNNGFKIFPTFDLFNLFCAPRDDSRIPLFVVSDEVTAMQDFQGLYQLVLILGLHLEVVTARKGRLNALFVETQLKLKP